MKVVGSMVFWSEVFYLREYKLGYLQENVETVVYAMMCFLVSFLIAHPQFLVGTLVNGALILGALNVRSHRLLPIIIMPSLGVLSAGLVFGPLTIFLFYMIPFIWVGNFILVYAFKYFYLNKKISKWFTLAGGAFAKAAFLFLAALTLYTLDVIPVQLLVAMGPVQLLTAVSGGVVAFIAQFAKLRLNRI